MWRYYIELNTSSDIVEFIDICSQIPYEVTIHGKDENGSNWSLSAKSFLCVLVMSAHLQNKQKEDGTECRLEYYLCRVQRRYLYGYF